jgi:hypothetical protein
MAVLMMVWMRGPTRDLLAATGLRTVATAEDGSGSYYLARRT